MDRGNEAGALRLVVVFLRFTTRMTQTAFGKASRVNQADLSRYERGSEDIPEEVLRRMAAAARVPWHFVAHLRRLFGAVLSARNRQSSASSGGDAPGPIGLDAALLAASQLDEDEGAFIEGRGQTTEEARHEAEEIWAALKCFPTTRHRALIDFSSRASRSWALAVKLSHESVRAAADCAEEALALADLAWSIAERVPGEERFRVQAYTLAHVANVRRVANDLDGANAAFTRAWDLWRHGALADPGLLPEWRLLDLEASLRREERQFRKALELLERAKSMAAAGGDKAAVARILLKKEFTLEQMGDVQGALATLAEATPYIEASGDPRQLFALRFKTVNNLLHSRRYPEAAERLPEVREIAGRLGNGLDLLRVLWLEARVLATQGRQEEAAARLEQVRQGFTVRQLPYDAALSSLDLAVLWLEAGRTAAVKELALAMAWLFKAQGIAREALAAFSLFFDAAERETATVELARRVIGAIEQVQRLAPPLKKGE